MKLQIALLATAATSVCSEHIKVGDGHCMSASNTKYDSYSITKIYTPTLCAAACQRTNGLVGFQMLYDKYCFCLFEDGRLPNPCPEKSYCDEVGEGVGSIVASDGDSQHMHCYKYIWA